MGLQRLYIDLTARKLVTSNFSTAGFGLPAMVQGDTATLELMFLKPVAGGAINAPYSIVNISGYDLVVAIGTPGGTPAALQNTWTAIEGNTVFSGVLSLNTAGITALLGANNQVTSTFEIELGLAGDYDTPIQIPVVLKKAVIATGSPVPPPGTEYYTVPAANATFVRKLGLAGETITLVSPNGVYGRILGVDNNGNATDDIVTL